MERIVIFGAGGHAKGVADSVRRGMRWRIEGFIDDVEPRRAGEPFYGATVLGGREALEQVRARGIEAMVLAIGNNAARLELAAEFAAHGWHFPAIVDPHSVVSSGAVLGDGCYIAPGAIVQPDAHIGAQSIVNLTSSVSHDCLIGAGVHLAPRVSVAGHVVIGRGVWVGIGAVVRDRVRIGDGTLVGAGALVLRDLPADVVAYGQPARVIRPVRA